MTEVEYLKLISSILSIHFIFDLFKDIRIHLERLSDKK